MPIWDRKTRSCPMTPPPRWLEKSAEEKMHAAQKMTMALKYLRSFDLQTFDSKVDSIKIAYRQITNANTTSNNNGPSINYQTSEPTYHTLVMLPGFNESMDKYHEIIQTLMNRIDNLTIYIYDHRGQGFSDREDAVMKLNVPLLAHSSDWKDFVRDAEQFVKTIVQPKMKKNELLHLFAHSTGGMIGTHLVSENPKMFTGSITLHCPLFKLILNNQLFEWLPILNYVAKFMCFCGFTMKSATFSDPQNPNTESFDGSKMCHDYQRAKFWHEKKVETLDPDFKLHGIFSTPSFGWFNQVLDGCSKIRNAAVKIQNKHVVIIQAEDEVLVSNREQRIVSSLIKNCKLLKVGHGGYHEMHTGGSKILRNLIINIIVQNMKFKDIALMPEENLCYSEKNKGGLLYYFSSKLINIFYWICNTMIEKMKQ